MAARQVVIVVTNTIVGQYEARSYPDEQKDASGYYNLYKVPIYRILVTGKDDTGNSVSGEYRAPRFMPYYNNPKRPSLHYKTLGWINCGLSSTQRVVISRYRRDYQVQNRYSPGIGAIVVHDTFYIHAGPATPSDVGFGSAGCIEIIGNFDVFKDSIVRMSGIVGVSRDDAITQLVKEGKLIVEIEQARVPDIKSLYSRKIKDW
ncbi:MAG: hypothetical protein WCG85_18400 [Polyangia bacterium]